MAIDTTSEELLSLTQAANRLPGHVNVCTVWRWVRKGVRGVHLEHVCLGSRIYTSANALSRFANALATIDKPHSATSSQNNQMPSVEREKSIQRAKAVLKEAGI